MIWSELNYNGVTDHVTIPLQVIQPTRFARHVIPDVVFPCWWRGIKVTTRWAGSGGDYCRTTRDITNLEIWIYMVLCSQNSIISVPSQLPTITFNYYSLYLYPQHEYLNIPLQRTTHLICVPRSLLTRQLYHSSYNSLFILPSRWTCLQQKQMFSW